MARRVREVIECDVCGKDGERYIVIYPRTGQFILDRCSRHNGKVMALQREKGEWVKTRERRRASFHISDPEQLLKDVAKEK